MFASIDELQMSLLKEKYIADKRTATTLFLAIKLEKPLLIEGPAGVGKTELAKVLAKILNTQLIRLQCYEGLDESKALFEWNYQKQLLRIQASRITNEAWLETKENIFSEEFFLARPLLKALQAQKPAVLLIDELDKSDEEFESFLLEALSEYQVSIPELGTVIATSTPIVILTSNNYRDFSDALKRRCLHLYIDYPSLEQEVQIVRLKVPETNKIMVEKIVKFVQQIRKLELKKPPSISETIDWANTLLVLGTKELSEEIVKETLNVILKYRQDTEKIEQRINGLLLG